jgi:PEGA domain
MASLVFRVVRGAVLTAMLVLPMSAAVPRLFAESLTLTSVPAGANVEINGNLVGQTPLKLDYPSVYFHKPHTAFGERLGHAMVLRISKPGFLSRQFTLSDGPLDWVGFTGKKHGTYFVLKSDHFEFKLDSANEPAGAAVGDEERPGPIRASHRAVEPVPDYPSDSGSLVISSDPSGADIYVDGQFAGQTPSTLHVAGGLHRIELRSDGRKPWLRELQITKGSNVSVHPALASDSSGEITKPS